MILSEPKTLFENGHTFDLVQHNQDFYGFLGHVDFEKVEVFRGKSLDSLEKICELKNARWGKGLSYDSRLFLFFTRQSHRIPFANPYLMQKIYCARIEADKIVSYRQVCSGSAPFAANLNGEYIFAYHKRFPHRIILNYRKSAEVVLSSLDELSAPSLAYYDGAYWMTCEARNKNQPWRTVRYYSKDLSLWSLADSCFLEGPCAFQHVFGKKYIVTYSVPLGKGQWKIVAREANVW